MLNNKILLYDGTTIKELDGTVSPITTYDIDNPPVLFIPVKRISTNSEKDHTLDSVIGMGSILYEIYDTLISSISYEISSGQNLYFPLKNAINYFGYSSSDIFTFTHISGFVTTTGTPNVDYTDLYFKLVLKFPVKPSKIVINLN